MPQQTISANLSNQPWAQTPKHPTELTDICVSPLQVARASPTVTGTFRDEGDLLRDLIAGLPPPGVGLGDEAMMESRRARKAILKRLFRSSETIPLTITYVPPASHPGGSSNSPSPPTHIETLSEEQILLEELTQGISRERTASAAAAARGSDGARRPLEFAGAAGSSPFVTPRGNESAHGEINAEEMDPDLAAGIALSLASMSPESNVTSSPGAVSLIARSPESALPSTAASPAASPQPSAAAAAERAVIPPEASASPQELPESCPVTPVASRMPVSSSASPQNLPEGIPLTPESQISFEPSSVEPSSGESKLSRRCSRELVSHEIMSPWVAWDAPDKPVTAHAPLAPRGSSGMHFFDCGSESEPGTPAAAPKRLTGTASAVPEALSAPLSGAISGIDNGAAAAGGDPGEIPRTPSTGTMLTAAIAAMEAGGGVAAQPSGLKKSPFLAASPQRLPKLPSGKEPFTPVAAPTAAAAPETAAAEPNEKALVLFTPPTAAVPGADPARRNLTLKHLRPPQDSSENPFEAYRALPWQEGEVKRQVQATLVPKPCPYPSPKPCLHFAFPALSHPNTSQFPV